MLGGQEHCYVFLPVLGSGIAVEDGPLVVLVAFKDADELVYVESLSEGFIELVDGNDEGFRPLSALGLAGGYENTVYGVPELHLCLDVFLGKLELAGTKVFLLALATKGCGVADKDILSSVEVSFRKRLAHLDESLVVLVAFLCVVEDVHKELPGKTDVVEHLDGLGIAYLLGNVDDANRNVKLDAVLIPEDFQRLESRVTVDHCLGALVDKDGVDEPVGTKGPDFPGDCFRPVDVYASFDTSVVNVPLVLLGELVKGEVIELDEPFCRRVLLRVL